MVKICPTCKKFVPESAQKCPMCGSTKLVLANASAATAAAVAAAKTAAKPKKKKSKAPVIISLLVILAIVGAASAGMIYFFKSGITINSDSINLKVGESSRLDVTTECGPVTYESTDTAVATVDSGGTVTAINVGSATITATNAKGRTADCTVNISHVQPTAVEFPQPELTIAPTQTTSVDIVFTPENTSDRALIYSIDQTSVATVDGNGTITGIAEGTATLTVKSANGVSATCTVTVLPYADSISIEPALKLAQQETGTLTVTFAPEGCAPEEIIWTSSDESIARVADGKVTAVSTGSVTITAETAQTHLTTSCSVTVTPPPLTITGLSMSRSASIAGSMYQISYDISAGAAGGSGGGYSYKFEIIQNGSVTKNTGWTTNNGISGSLSGNGTCSLRVTVRDSTGATTSDTYDMLN